MYSRHTKGRRIYKRVYDTAKKKNKEARFVVVKRSLQEILMSTLKPRGRAGVDAAKARCLPDWY
jgi:hypothetical protein